MTGNLIEAVDVVKHFTVKKGLMGEKKTVRAVDGVDVQLQAKQNLALVGESGCGKTTLGRILTGIIKPTSGRVNWNLVGADGGSKKLARFIQPIFQDPYTALNPQKLVKQIIEKPFKIHGLPSSEETLIRLLEEVGLNPGSSFLDRYPHQLSGGQRQRVVIARALALKPKVIVADEPFSGLDVTVQTQIMKLLLELGEKFDMTYLLITHDINLVRFLCDSTVVMYLGKVVETGPTKEVLGNQMHPYTTSLLKSTPSGEPADRGWINAPVKGDVPSATAPPSGCRFHPRCPLAVSECSVSEPVLEEYMGRKIACPVVVRSAKAGAGPA